LECSLAEGSSGYSHRESLLNSRKVLALNRTLGEYFRLVKWYLCFNSNSRMFLHENGYDRAKRLFDLNTALIQTARDRAVEVRALRRLKGRTTL